MTNPTPDAALLWARETAAPHHGYNRTMDRAEAFRAGQSHADAGLLAALEGMVAIQDVMDREGACDDSFIEPRVTAARAAIAATREIDAEAIDQKDWGTFDDNGTAAEVADWLQQRANEARGDNR